MKRTLALAALLSVVRLEPAHAFSDPAMFAEDAELGGGARRYFTGSPVDGYSCASCHSGGATPALVVRGLPRAGYVPGQAYTVELSWPEPQVPQALQLEFVSPSGVSPTLTLAADGAEDAREHCGQNAELDRASYIVTEGARKIAGVRDCHAGALVLQFVAPPDGELTFAATLVRSDSSASPSGDGVIETAVVLRPAGTQAGVSGGCSVVNSAQTELGLWVAGAYVVGLGVRRRQRKSRLSSAVAS